MYKAPGRHPTRPNQWYSDRIPEFRHEDGDSNTLNNLKDGPERTHESVEHQNEVVAAFLDTDPYSEIFDISYQALQLLVILKELRNGSSDKNADTMQIALERFTVSTHGYLKKIENIHKVGTQTQTSK